MIKTKTRAVHKTACSPSSNTATTYQYLDEIKVSFTEYPSNTCQVSITQSVYKILIKNDIQYLIFPWRWAEFNKPFQKQ